MKTRFIIISILLLNFSLIAQKGDYNWFFSYTKIESNGGLGGFDTVNYRLNYIDFNDSIPTSRIIDPISSVSFLFTNTSISDTAGQLIALTNGTYLYDGFLDKMKNSPINYPYPAFERGRSTIQAVLLLPFPEKPDSSILLMADLQKNDQNSWKYNTPLLYSIISKSANGGQGEVVEQKTKLLNDTLGWGQMTACRHGNGRDWWILVQRDNSNKHYRIKLSPEGPKVIGSQIVGDSLLTGLGQAVFSPDGRWYARYNVIYYQNPNVLDLYRFDRCSGLLSDHKRQIIGVQGKHGGVAFSPNSRFLYVASLDSVYQYDMNAADIFASQTLVAVVDTFLEPQGPGAPGSTRCYFFTMQLAPDGKIYESVTGSRSRYLHVINKPDSLGLACDFKQRGFKMPKFNEASLPTFPFFRLTNVIDCPPDSTSSTNEAFSKNIEMSISPNPANDFFDVQINGSIDGPIEFQLFDLTGKTVHAHHFEKNERTRTFDTEHLPSGLFWAKIFNEKDLLSVKKVIIQKN